MPYTETLVYQLWASEWKSLSRVQLFETPWIEFSRPEYWSG